MNTASDLGRNIRIGIFTAGALTIFAMALLVVGKKSGFFVTSYRLIGEFEQVAGLAVGQPVWLSGLEIGLVEGLQLADPGSNRIRVTLAIQTRYQDWVRSDSTALLETKGLLGDRIVNITPGSVEAGVLQNGDTIQTVAPVDLFEVVGGAGKIIASVDGLVQEFTKLTASLMQGEGSLGKLIADDSLYREVEGITSGLNKFVESMNAGKGTLGRLVVDDALYNELSSSAQTLAGLLGEVEQGEGSLGALLKKPDLHDGTTELLESVRQLSEELNTMVEDIKANPRKYFKFSVF